MSSYGLMHKAAEVELNNRESLLDALRCLSDYDCDFSGENGLDYTCQEAKDAGYESNQDYYIDQANEFDDDKECIHHFLSEWLDNDNYYHEWNYEVIEDSFGRIIAISVAALTYC